MIQFFGRGSAFTDSHNSAFFEYESDLIVIDCPMSAFQHLKDFDLQKYTNIYILVTHTHGDHIGGIGTFLQYLFFNYNKKITVVAPSIDVYDDLLLLLCKIEGCNKEWFQIQLAERLDTKWLKQAVPTAHVDALQNKCFGYILEIDTKTVIYTGDTRTLEPFKPYIKQGVILYSEISVSNSGVHLFIDTTLPTLTDFASNGVAVYLMHLDDEDAIKNRIKNTSILLAPLYDKGALSDS